MKAVIAVVSSVLISACAVFPETPRSEATYPVVGAGGPWKGGSGSAVVMEAEPNLSKTPNGEGSSQSL